MKKSTKIIIAVVSVLVVAAIVFAVLYFATDLFKTKNPKKAFFENLEKYAIGEGNYNYSEMLEKAKSKQNSTFEGKGKITMNLELGEDLIDEDAQALLELLNKMEINYESKSDPKNLNTNMVMDLKYDGNDLATLELLLNEDKVGFKIKDITDKYLTISLEDALASEALDDLDLDSIKGISEENMNEIMDLLNISDDQIKSLTNILKKSLEDAIPEDKFSSEKAKITVNGKELNTTAYTVKISGNDTMKFLSNVLEGLKNDDDMLSLGVNKFNKLMKIAGETSMKITKSEAKAFLESMVSELKDTDMDDDSTYKITLYVNKDQTVRLEFAQDNNAITIDSIKDGDTTNTAFKVKVSGSEMTLLNVEETKKGDNKYSTKLSTDMQGVKIEVTLDTDSTDSNERVNMKLYAEVLDQMKLTLNMEAEAKETSVKIDKLTSSNSIDAENIPSSEQEKIMTNLVNYLDKNKSTIKDIAKDIGYEDEIEEFISQLEYLKSGLSSQIPVAPTTPDEGSEAA